MRHTLGTVTATIALAVVPLAACDQAQDQLSKTDACGDLVEISLSELRKVRERLGNMEQIEQSLRDAAQRARDKVQQVEDQDVKRAAREYADRMRELADKAANGEAIDIDAVARANRELARACTS